MESTLHDYGVALAYLREDRDLRAAHRANLGGVMKEEEKKKGPEKPVSLDPLAFEDALKALLQVKPNGPSGRETPADPARNKDH